MLMYCFGNKWTSPRPQLFKAYQLPMNERLLKAGGRLIPEQSTTQQVESSAQTSVQKKKKIIAAVFSNSNQFIQRLLKNRVFLRRGSRGDPARERGSGGSPAVDRRTGGRTDTVLGNVSGQGDGIPLAGA